MLSIQPLSQGQSDYYTRLAAVDYYTDGGEPVGHWFGTVAAALGLTDRPVTSRDLRRLFDGYTPTDPRKPLVQNAGDDRRQCGWDLTFSAPKSVSALWACASDDVRSQIEAVHRTAVESTLERLQSHFGFTRRGAAGKRRERVGWAVALFGHSTSRAMEPQLHVHCLVLNLGLRRDGTFGTLLSKIIFENKMLGGAWYQEALAAGLTASLGVTCVKEEVAFRIAGVPEPLVGQWSTRRREVEQKLSEMGVETASAAAFAALSTRRAKEMIPPRRDLLERWQEQAQPFGNWVDRVLSPSPHANGMATETLTTSSSSVQASRNPRGMDGDEQALFEAIDRQSVSPDERTSTSPTEPKHASQNESTRDPSFDPVSEQSHASQGASSPFDRDLVVSWIRHSAEALTKNNTHFTGTDLLGKVAARATEAGVTVSPERLSAVIRREARLERSLVTLVNGRDEKVYTTPAVLAEEKTLLRAAARMQRHDGAGLSAKQAERLARAYTRRRSLLAQVLKAHARRLVDAAMRRPTSAIDIKTLWREARFTVSDQQAKTIAALTRRDSSRVRFLEGDSGVGKTRSLSVAARILRDSGYRVIGTALGGVATTSLAKDGKIESYNYATLMARMRSPTVGRRLRHTGLQLARALFNRKTYRLERLKLDRSTVLIVDEAAMLGNAQLGELLRAAERAGATVILCGDRQKIQAMGRGGGFAHLVDRFGSTHLTENRRQTSEVDRELVDALTQGDHARASAILKESQRLKVADTRSSALNLLIADWGEDAARRHASGERLSPIIAATNASVYDANVQCQQELRQRGVITADAKRVRHKDQWLHVGDRVMITKTSRRLDLNHGELGRVMKITQRLRRTTLTIALDRGGDAKVSLKKFGHVRLGYAMTAHQSQGRSLSDNVYVLLGGKPQDRELTLTAASRTSGSTFFYDRPVEPGAGFERHAEVSRQKQMAAAAMHLAMDEAQRKRSRSE